MKGVVFNLLEEFLDESFGLGTWEKVMEKANLDQAFVSPLSYPDEDFMSLVSSAVDLANLPPRDAVFAFGKFCFPKLISKIPNIIDKFDHPEQILLNVDSIIHVEVKKMFDQAQPPKFDVKKENDKIVMHYSSKKKLSVFAEGLIEGMAEYYSLKMNVKKTVLEDNEYEKCLFEIEMN